MRKSSLALITVLLALCCCPPPARAQSTGSVRGTVLDSQGGGVPDAEVTLANQATNTKMETRTNGEGLFVFSYVNPASYDLTVKKEGFKTFRVAVTVQVAQTLTLNPTMELGQVSETVTVIESAVTINTTNGE